MVGGGVGVLAVCYYVMCNGIVCQFSVSRKRFSVFNNLLCNSLIMLFAKVLNVYEDDKDFRGAFFSKFRYVLYGERPKNINCI